MSLFLTISLLYKSDSFSIGVRMLSTKLEEKPSKKPFILFDSLFAVVNDFERASHI